MDRRKKINRNIALVKQSENNARIVSSICTTIKFIFGCFLVAFIFYQFKDIITAQNPNDISQNTDSTATLLERILSAIKINDFVDFLPWSGWISTIILTVYIRLNIKSNNFLLEFNSGKKDKSDNVVER